MLPADNVNPKRSRTSGEPALVAARGGRGAAGGMEPVPAAPAEQQPGPLRRDVTGSAETGDTSTTGGNRRWDPGTAGRDGPAPPPAPALPRPLPPSALPAAMATAEPGCDRWSRRAAPAT